MMEVWCFPRSWGLRRARRCFKWQMRLFSKCRAVFVLIANYCDFTESKFSEAAHDVRFGHGVETENRNKPDFLFPGQTEYRDMAFPAARLTMLGAKSTLKDRWRQVLSEAVRIDQKHLLTLEPGISENQTDEMRAKLLQLVVPRRLHATFKPTQQAWLVDVSSFIAVVVARQQ